MTSARSLTRLRSVVQKAAGRLRSRTIWVAVQDLDLLVFGQQHVGNARFFESRYGQSHTIPLSEFPHSRFLVDAEGRAAYEEYLSQSWATLRSAENTAAARQAHMARFMDRFEKVARGERIEAPLPAYRRRDGRLVVIDGNHRAAIAFALRQPLAVRVVPTRYALRGVATSYLATERRYGRPPSTVVDRNKTLVRGRSSAAVDRAGALDSRDVEGKTILDLGCGIGASAFVLMDRGAKRVIGLDHDAAAVSAALRLNAYFARDCDFRLLGSDGWRDWAEHVDTMCCRPDVALSIDVVGVAARVRPVCVYLPANVGHRRSGASLLPGYRLQSAVGVGSVQLLRLVRDD